MERGVAVHDCACGLRYMRSVIHLDAVERARADCGCGALLGEWYGPNRFVFEPEDPSSPANTH